MYTALKEKMIVKKGGILEVRSPELRKGMQVEVIVIVSPSAATSKELIEHAADSVNVPDKVSPTCESEEDYETRQEVWLTNCTPVPTTQKSGCYSFVGIGETRNPTTSIKEIELPYE